MKHWFVSAVILVASFMLALSSGLAQNVASEIYVVDELVYADIPPAPLSTVLSRLAKAAGIELKLAGDIKTEVELYANGSSFSRVLDTILPDGCGFALELGPDQKIKRITVFSTEEATRRSKPVNERQRYLARQMGIRDDSTADIMRETLSDRSLDDVEAKLIAIEQLVEIKSEYAQRSLQAGMGDKDPKVRISTARALFRLQGDEAITLIGQIYYAEDSALIRREVAAVVVSSPHPLAQTIVKESGVKK